MSGYCGKIRYEGPNLTQKGLICAERRTKSGVLCQFLVPGGVSAGRLRDGISLYVLC